MIVLGKPGFKSWGGANFFSSPWLSKSPHEDFEEEKISSCIRPVGTKKVGQSITNQILSLRFSFQFS